MASNFRALVAVALLLASMQLAAAGPPTSYNVTFGGSNYGGWHRTWAGGQEAWKGGAVVGAVAAAPGDIRDGSAGTCAATLRHGPPCKIPLTQACG